jgi:hypothetical protein
MSQKYFSSLTRIGVVGKWLTGLGSFLQLHSADLIDCEPDGAFPVVTRLGGQRRWAANPGFA